MDQAVGRDVEVRLPHLRPIRAAGDGRRDKQGDHDLYTASLGEPLSLPRRTIGKLRLRDVGTGLGDFCGGVGGGVISYRPTSSLPPLVNSSPQNSHLKTQSAHAGASPAEQWIPSA